MKVDGGSSIVKVPGDVPPGRVYFFKLSRLAKGILFANFSHLNWARVRQFRSKKCQTLVTPAKKPTFFQILVKRMQKFGKFCLENAKSWHC